MQEMKDIQPARLEGTHLPDTQEFHSIEDLVLVQAAQEGHARAFEELVIRYYERTQVRAFNMLHDEAAARDLAQEAWIRAWEKLHQLREETSFAGWMTRIVSNLCLDQLRRDKRHFAESLDDEEAAGFFERELPVIHCDFTAGLHRNEVRTRIDCALQQLSPDHQAVIVLREIEQLEYKQIAKIVKCSLGTVMSRLYYTRRKMAALLADLKPETGVR